MIHAHCLNDLRRFGVELLTGEADNLGFRVLCDLTAKGRELVAETYSLFSTGFRENWNNGSRRDPHVASVMLAEHDWRSIAIVGFALEGLTTILTDRGLFALEEGEEFKQAEYTWDKASDDAKLVAEAQIFRGGTWMKWPAFYGKPQRVFRGNPGHPHVGTRNTHSMSGRSY
ncbi:MAG: hypothetical protein ABSG53_26735 [Thermoguttaceae bacterium]|jgi:hypothetical protein